MTDALCGWRPNPTWTDWFKPSSTRRRFSPEEQTCRPYRPFSGNVRVTAVLITLCTCVKNWRKIATNWTSWSNRSSLWRLCSVDFNEIIKNLSVFSCTQINALNKTHDPMRITWFNFTVIWRSSRPSNCYSIFGSTDLWARNKWAVWSVTCTNWGTNNRPQEPHRRRRQSSASKEPEMLKYWNDFEQVFKVVVLPKIDETWYRVVLDSDLQLAIEWWGCRFNATIYKALTFTHRLRTSQL